MKKLLLLTTILSLCLASNAQKIGEWVTHTPGMQVISVEMMHNNIFAATPYDIFYYNTYDNSVNHLSKVNGLSDMGISMIKYDENSDILFIGYSNTNIDIIDRYGDVTNIPDIYNKYILGDKSINNVYFHGKFAYVCCGFGIVVIDMNKNEVKDTYIIGPNGSYLAVNDLTINNNVFYAATEHGVYYADADNPFLADYTQWKLFAHHIPHTTEKFSNIENFDGYVVTNYSDPNNDSDELYMISDTTSWSYFINGTTHVISEMRACDNKLIVTEKSRRFKVYDTNHTVTFTSSNIDPNSTLFDKTNNCYWAGTKTNSLAKVYPDGNHELIPFNGPYSDKTFSITASGNMIWVAAGGYTSTWAKTWNHNGFSYYDGVSWNYINNKSLPSYGSITDITWVKTDPTNSNIVYAATYDDGLIVFENGEIKTIYNSTNSSLGKHLMIDYTYVTGFDFDSNNNMWLANTGSGKMLSVWRRDGSWQAYNIGSGDIGRIMVDKNDIKWIYKRGGELVVFNGNTVKTVSKSASYGNLPGDANCFAVDSKGTVWIGTTDGVALFYDSKKIFSNSTYSCSRILIPRNDGSGQADYLLSGQSVLSIAIDGADNIWFGTTNGVIQTSNDGQTTYHHFTVENSPLLYNTVNDIAIDDDGNVYFATDKGIMSYKGTATKGNDTNSNVIVYPNPVRPEHNGIVGIKGLVTNALVKITNPDGTFVTHLQAEGGQAIWDCTDINGNNVKPGIYLIFVSDETGKETYATKVLIMR